MSEQKIEPHKITKPIQLLAVWFVALFLVVGSFLGAAAAVGQPEWIPGMLAIAAVVCVPMFLGAAFVMQTRFRTHLQDDQYFAQWLRRQESTFESFAPENLVPEASSGEAGDADRASLDTESRRLEIYSSNRGLFLVHAWRPSTTAGQVADITIWLAQHRDGPLTEGLVDRVEYHLGPKFFHGGIAKRGARDGFKLGISAYGPMLCLAVVYLKGERDPIELQRYIDFEEAP